MNNCMDSPSKISNKTLILIPAYNAEAHLVELVKRIQNSILNAEILIINDGSTDKTAEIAASLPVHFLNNRINQGKGYTLNKGFRYAVEHAFKFVVTIDADLQHLPEEITNFIGFSGAADIYIGTRDLRSADMPPHRKLSNWLTSLIISIFSGQRIRDSQSGYRMLSTEAIQKLSVESVRYDFESEQLFQAGALKFHVAEVPVSTVYCFSRSYINPLIDTTRFVRLIWRRIMM